MGNLFSSELGLWEDVPGSRHIKSRFAEWHLVVYKMRADMVLKIGTWVAIAG